MTRLPDDQGSPGLPTGGPLRLAVDDLREIVAALAEADADLVRDFKLSEAAFEPDAFVAGDAYTRAVERWVRAIWTHLAFFDLDCDSETFKGA